LRSFLGRAEGWDLGKGLTKILENLTCNVIFSKIFAVKYKYKYKYNSYFYCAPYSLTDGALQKSANTCFTAVGRLK